MAENPNDSLSSPTAPVAPTDSYLPRSVGRNWIIAGAIFAALAVIAGAFGAHALETAFATAEEGPRRLAAWKTGAQYQMVHALGLILLGLMPTTRLGAKKAAGILLVAGILIFSGVLYVYALSHIRILGAIVPLGGLSMIGGWVMFAIAATGCQSKEVS